MAQHIFKKNGPPEVTDIPTEIGHHFVDTLNKIPYISVGTSSYLDWKPNTALLRSINGIQAYDIVLNNGTAGVAPNYTDNGVDTITLNIPNASAAGVTAGLLSKSKYDQFDSKTYPIKNVLRVIKNTTLGTQDFSSIVTALNSITDASISNPYLIEVGPGLFIEDTIIGKQFVTIAGSGQEATTIQVNATNKHIIIGEIYFNIQDVSLTGATDAGKSAIYFNPTGDFAAMNVRNVTFMDNDNYITVLVNSAQFAYISATNIYVSTFIAPSIGFLAQSTTGLPAYLLITQITAQLYAPVTDFILAHGLNGTIIADNVAVNSLGGGRLARAYDGGALNVRQSHCDGFDTAIETSNIGAAPVIKINGSIFTSITNDLLISHPGTTGAFQGFADGAKVFVDPASSVKLDYLDTISPDTGSVILGEMKQGDRHDQLVSISKLIRNTTPLGIFTGGALSIVSGLTVALSAGYGFLENSISSFVQEISWITTNIVLSANTSNYIYINDASVVSSATSIPSNRSNIIVGRVVTGASSILYIDRSSFNIDNLPTRIEDFQREALGPVYASGSLLAENGTRQLDIGSGIFYFGNTRFTPSGGTAVTWTSYYGNGSGGFTKASQSVVDNAKYDNGSGTLANLTAGYYAKHSLYIVGDDGSEKYFLVYSQAQYSSLVVAEQSNIPSPPNDFIDGVTLIASIIVQQGVTNITSIRDERPIIGFKASGVSAAAVHGNLLGLSADDHTQYLLANGTRAMTGNLDLGGNSIVNVTLVDGVDVTAHASRHLPNGADPITTTAPLSNVTATTSNSVGTANSLARSDHSHAITTGAASGQAPDQVNAIGSSASLARADHIHNIPTAAPSANLTASTSNSLGITASFTRSDHSHAITTGAASGQSPDQANAVGSSASLARADHVHNIPTAAASGLTAGSSNTQGASASFARADHTHAISSGAPSTQTPDQLNATGTSTNFARADHIHTIATATPSALSPGTANAQGSSTSFARADHVHNIPTAAPTANLTASTTNAEGTGVSFTRNDHSHAITTGAAANQTPDQTSAAGSSASLARADHVHNIPTAAATSISTSTTNTQGSASTFARADHTHAVSISNTTVSGSSVISTTSSSDTLITGMTITPVAGTYYVSGRANVSATSNSRFISISVYMGGSQVANTEMTCFIRTGGTILVTSDTGTPNTTAVVTVNGSQAIELRWSTTGGTAQASSYALIILKLS